MMVILYRLLLFLNDADLLHEPALCREEYVPITQFFSESSEEIKPDVDSSRFASDSGLVFTIY